jgi:hypothetical protein
LTYARATRSNEGSTMLKSSSWVVSGLNGVAPLASAKQPCVAHQVLRAEAPARRHVRFAALLARKQTVGLRQAWSSVGSAVRHERPDDPGHLVG